ILPVDPQRQTGCPWVIEMEGLGNQKVSLVVEIAGDVVVGINRPGQPAPDLDLGAYEAEDKGVSRRHAVLRPARNRLYLIDLQSTNGTRVNTVLVSAGIARELHTSDTITLGALTFTIKVLATPETLQQNLLSMQSGIAVQPL